MTWQYIVMHSDLSDIEASGFMNDLVREHEREVAEGKIATYQLHRRKDDGGEQIILIPPEISHLVARMSRWKPHIKQCLSKPDTTGFKKVTLR